MTNQLSATIIFFIPVITFLILLGIAITIVKLAIKYLPIAYQVIKSYSNKINTIEIIKDLFSTTLFNN